MSRPLRIAFVSPLYAPCVGGGELHLKNVAERLVQRGHQVSVVTWNAATIPQMVAGRGSDLPEVESMCGVEVRRVRPNDRISAATQWWLAQRGGWRSAKLVLGEKYLWALGPPSAAKLVRPLLDTGADVIGTVNWLFAPAFAGDVAARLQRIPVVAVPLFHVGRPWTLRPYYRTLVSRCYTVLTNTSAEGEFAASIGARRVDVGGCGVDPTAFAHADGATLRERYGLGNDPVIGFVGRQDRLKGAPTLLEAMKIVWETYDCARVLLAGPAAHRDRATSDQLRAIRAAHPSGVVLIDDFPAQQAPDIFSACDVVALPSVEESFGLVFLESWICGTPVIGCRIPAVEQVIDHQRDGLLVEPESPRDLAHAILRLLSDEGERRRMGVVGRAKVMASFTWEQVTDRWEESLSRAARAGRRALA